MKKYMLGFLLLSVSVAGAMEDAQVKQEQRGCVFITLANVFGIIKDFLHRFHQDNAELVHAMKDVLKERNLSK